jgi:hypothetical protein
VHLPSSQLSCLWKEQQVTQNYRSAVSMHGHTNRSKESLSFISEFAQRNPVLRVAFAMKAKEADTKSSITVDLKRAYWTPPVPPLEAFRLERDQIQRVLGLEALVSLSDHDNIEAPMLLRVLPEAQHIPVSTEWTVPYQESKLHLGIHNLPGCCAEMAMARLNDYTANATEKELRAIFRMLDEMPDVLIVLNHPLWDLAHVGKQRHVRLIHDFLGDFGMYIHALELGGFRGWEENQAVLDLAERWDQLVIGGGDRHGAEPSAVVNLTNAATFAEFVREVREKRRCHVLVMPQYTEAFPVRVIQSLLDAIREYPDFPEGSRRWDERVFHPDSCRELKPLITLWERPTPFIEVVLSVFRLLESPAVRKTLVAALARPKHEMQFVSGRGREVVSRWTKAYGSRSSRMRTTKSTAWPTRAGSLRRSPKGADSPS